MACILPPAVSEQRRTQAERRAAMKGRVLAATIDCLVELGYANTSTRHIARRARVTVGAVQHHFDSKAELMAAALQQLGERMADDFLAEAPEGGTPPRERIAVLLDRLWAVHRSPLFDAGLELSVAARTDPELRRAMNAVAQAFALRIAEGMLQTFPDLVARPGFAEAVMVGLATLRGLALPAFVEVAAPDELWTVARPQLLAAFERLGLGDREAASR
jgi:AcrR family transcriptional regulator